MEFKELVNLCLMANNDITKEEICMMANKNINIDEVNEFEPQITFDDLQDAFDAYFMNTKKQCIRKMFYFKVKLI
ncbi:hypothetical protein NC653_003770 [Populus alba x Populus x berolinensis]|uniref:Uncharacterized protein n=1 Tax=Populus alba x Populus x berolinensis TaxID=444605 RepID=A0AAD6RSC8_9ROSI|nr:hypothetical protein NC653_003770 [Populus alba x Populus x berolinensis]